MVWGSVWGGEVADEVGDCHFWCRVEFGVGKIKMELRGINETVVNINSASEINN